MLFCLQLGWDSAPKMKVEWWHNGSVSATVQPKQNVAFFFPQPQLTEISENLEIIVRIQDSQWPLASTVYFSGLPGF